MYLTENDLINAKLTADGSINESDILKYIIKEDQNCEKKKKMIEGERYYAYEHDILKKDFRQSSVCIRFKKGIWIIFLQYWFFYGLFRSLCGLAVSFMR